MNYHSLPIEMAIIKKTNNNKCLQSNGESGSWWEHKMASYSIKVWQFLNKLLMDLQHNLANLLPGI